MSPEQSRITDPDVQILAGLSATLAADYVGPGTDPWAGSPFAWIRTRASAQRGKIGEQLLAGWAAAKGLDVTRSRTPGADRVINGKRIEIKFSTLWEKGDYLFQQIRDQDYEHAAFLGISPFSASCWVVPKALLVGRLRPGLRGQHAGAAAVDTTWLRFRATQPPTWLAQYGGPLREAYRLLAS